MISRQVLSVLLLPCALGVVAPTWADSCVRETTPSAAYLRKVDALVRKLKASKSVRADFRAKLQENANKERVCTKNDSCCTDIPLYVTMAVASTTKCEVAVDFRYSKLTIDRNHGNHTPQITWKLVFEGVPPDYQFGTSGIKIDVMGGFFPPVHTMGADKCTNGTAGDQYICKGNGKKDAQAGHKANVYPKAHPNEAAYRCDNIDPLINNID